MWLSDHLTNSHDVVVFEASLDRVNLNLIDQ
jgi:hypothetical protein